jgi:hypothetical protein
MKALIISLESFQKGEVTEEVKKYIIANHGNVFTILDESSKIKTNNPCKESKKSKRTQAILKLNKIGHRCILTGTFMSKTPVNAYDQMKFLSEDFFKEGMFAFAERYEIRRALPSVRGARITLPEKDYETIRKRLLSCGSDSYLLSARMDSIKSFYGVSREECMHILKNKEYTPFKNIDELWNRIGDTCIHLKKEDILDIPPKVYKTYKVDLTSEQKKLYLQLQNQHCTDNITVDNGLKLYLRFQDICNGYEPVETEETVIVNGEEKHKVELIPLKENPKLDLLEELVEDIGEEQIVVWCSRAKLLHDAKERLTNAGYTCGVYDGKVKREDREKDYSAFENKEIQILFVNQASGAYGLDGLKKANYAIYLCNSYSVEQREQSEDRIYRGLVSTNKYIIDLTCQGTCEDRVTEALKQGKQLLDTGMTDASLFILEE